MVVVPHLEEFKMIRVIDNKKIDLTEDEWKMYQSICSEYTTPTFKGTDLFTDLFETNNEGVIVFLKPPKTKRTTLEAWLYLAAVYQHQHMRNLYKHVDDKLSELTNSFNSLKKEIENK
jgi:hypothetical protein